MEKQASSEKRGGRLVYDYLGRVNILTQNVWKNKKSRHVLFIFFMIFALLSISFAFIRISREEIEFARATDVSGNIETNTTWTLANSPYNMTNHVYVKSGATLTIEAGVEVRSNGDYELQVQSGGAIDVNGSSGNEVVFKHNTYTDAGRWRCINVLSTATANISYTEFYSCKTGVRVQGGSLDIDNSTFDVGNAGISVYEQGSLTTDSNTFTNQTYYPLVLNVDVGTVTLGSNGSADTMGSGNGYDGIGVAYNDTGSSDCPSDTCSFPQRTFAGVSNIPYVIYQDYVVGGSNDTLEVDAGVIIKSRANVDLVLRNGAVLDVNGTSGNEVIFTSHYDDTYGGDTNNDGTSTSPSEDNWKTITIEDGSTTNTIDYAKIRYGAIGVRIFDTGTKATVQHTIFNNNRVGIAVHERGELTTARNTFRNQTYYPLDLSVDVGTITLGSGADADDIRAGETDENAYDCISIGYADNATSNCNSNLCKIQQRTFAGISNIAYVLHTDYVVSDSNGELEIDAGVVVKPLPNVDLSLRGGAIIDINGTSGNEVIFTSIYDDTYGGDTNNDSTSTSPSDDNWKTITIEDGSTTSTIDYAKIRYGAIGVRIFDTGTKVTVQDTIFNTNRVGISVYERGELTTARNTFRNQTYYPLDLSVDVGTITLGSGADADDIRAGETDENAYDCISIGYGDNGTSNCNSNLCKIQQRTFAGISNITYVLHPDYVVNDSDGELEIDAGVVVKPLPNVDLFLRGGAIIDINGTSGNEVIFTSIYDDTYGGDTNNDGTSTSPSEDNWKTITIEDGSTTNTIDYAKIRYGAVGVIVFDTGTKVTVQDTIFNTNRVGISVYERGELATARNTFRNQTYYPMNINPDVGTITLGSGADADDIRAGETDENAYECISFGYNDNGTSDCPSDICTFPQRNLGGISNIPYVMYTDYVINGSNDTLTIDAGVVIKALANTDLYVKNGAKIDINGASNNYVYFTSHKNDYVAGDTNNDGTATLPAKDNWKAINLEGAGAHDISYLDCSYGNWCLYINGATNVTVSNSNFRLNNYGIYSNTTTVPTVSNFNIEGNYTYGFYNSKSNAISAENMWWGASNGPLDTDAGGQCVANAGSGDTVSDDASHQIDYCPYSSTMLRAPSVTTNTTTGITENAATGNGTINTFGYYFAEQYGHVWDTSANPVLGGGPDGHWKMNDNAANSTVIDSAGSDDGTYVGAGGTDDYTSAHSVTGKINTALEFDGTNDHIDIPMTAPTLPFTIAFWVNPDSSTPIGMFDSAPGLQNVIRNYGDGQIEWWSNDPEMDLNLSASTWQHLVFIIYYDGSRKIDYYKNGSFQETGVGGTNTSFAWNGFNIGNINNGSAGKFAGDIDDFRIYDYKLTPGEVTNLYNSGLGTETTNFFLGKTEKGAKSTVGSYTSNISDLEASTTYYTRAYFIQTDGTVTYGSDDSFTTGGGNNAPVASSATIDSGATNINLAAGSTKEVVCEATVTDLDGYTNILSVEANLYRTGVGYSASDDDNNHYTLTGDTECVPSNGSGNTEDYTCTFDVQFHAEPTDVGTYSADNWTCRVMPSDSVGEGTADTDTIEMNTLLAISVTSSIGYGELGEGEDTGSTNETTVVTNNGNVGLDLELSGYNMCTDYPGCSGNTIGVGNQEYSLSGFTWGSGTDLPSTSSPNTVDISISKPTTSPSNGTGNVYWGIGVPAATKSGVYQGENVFTAVTDS